MTAHCQRWSAGRIQSWRSPADGGFDAARYAVAEIDEATARPFVTGWHYSGTFPAARLCYGLFDTSAVPFGDPLVGVAVLSVPARAEVLTNVFPGLDPYAQSLELGRFVLDDAVPANGESWFLAEVRRLAGAAGLRGLVSFSDPMPRTTAAGQLIMPGHIGIAYQASNAVYLGRATRRTIALLPDGTVFSDRAAQKIRRAEQGHDYAEQQLVAHGAVPLAPGQDRAAWLRDALGQAGARKMRHPGNHRYAWPLGDRAQRRAVVIAGDRAAYPRPAGPDLLDLL